MEITISCVIYFQVQFHISFFKYFFLLYVLYTPYLIIFFLACNKQELTSLYIFILGTCPIFPSTTKMLLYFCKYPLNYSYFLKTISLRVLLLTSTLFYHIRFFSNCLAMFSKQVSRYEHWQENSKWCQAISIFFFISSWEWY